MTEKTKKLLVLFTVIMTFSVLGIVIIFLAKAGVISAPAAILMLVALVGIYLGFGILLVAHLMVKKLE